MPSKSKLMVLILGYYKDNKHSLKTDYEDCDDEAHLSDCTVTCFSLSNTKYILKPFIASRPTPQTEIYLGSVRIVDFDWTSYRERIENSLNYVVSPYNYYSLFFPRSRVVTPWYDIITIVLVFYVQWKLVLN